MSECECSFFFGTDWESGIEVLGFSLQCDEVIDCE